MKNIRLENRLLIMLAFFSVGVGLWENIRQLWLESNGLSVSQISFVLSAGAFISGLALLIIAINVNFNKMKQLISFSLILKFLTMLILFFINNTGYTSLIKFFTIIDLIFEMFIFSSIYPLILTIKKDEKFYSKRKLTEYLFRDIGILIGGIFIGKTIFSFNIDYNICLFISIVFIGIASVIMMRKIKITNTNIKSVISFKNFINDKIILLHCLSYFIGHFSLAIALGLQILMLTNGLNFSDNNAIWYLLVVGLFADIFGILALKYLTPKNDYLTIFLKFGIRAIWFFIAFITNNTFVIILAITWSIFISTAYENKTDAPYIHRVALENQLFYTNIKQVVKTFGNSFGLFIAGIVYNYGINYLLGVSSIFVLLQMLIQWLMIYLRSKEVKM